MNFKLNILLLSVSSFSTATCLFYLESSFLFFISAFFVAVSMYLTLITFDMIVDNSKIKGKIELFEEIKQTNNKPRNNKSN